jgi:hypothetical protein
MEATLYQGPNEYNLEGGGSYCFEGDGAEVTLSGSDVDVDYELYLDGTPTGTIVEGTGSEISFGYQTDEGFYSAIAYNDNCDLLMVNQVQVSIMYAPGAPDVPAGLTEVCNDQTTDYETTGVDGADTYGWEIMPTEAGTLIESDMEVSIEWNVEFSGEVELMVYGINDCGAGTYSEILVIDVDDIPEPVIDGESLVCDDQVETYSVNDTEGHSYVWEVTGGNIIEGEGTSTITIEWGAPGDGTVNMEESTPNGCLGSAAEFLVTIDECTGLGEHQDVDLLLNPNPARESVNILSDQLIKSVTIINLTGKEILRQTIHERSAVVNTSTIDPGLYLVRIELENRIVVKRLLIE